MEPQTNKKGGENEAKQNAQQSLAKREIIQTAAPVHSNPAAQQSGNKPERGSWRNEWRHPQVIVNTILAFITMGIGTIYYFQLQQMKLSTDANKKAADAAAIAADSAKQSTDISQRSLGLTEKSIGLTQRNTELSQRNVELAQKNLDAVQQGLQYASKANEISKTGLETANMPSLDVRIISVNLTNSYFILKSKNGIEVTYLIQNHSDAPAPKVFAQCFLEKHRGHAFDPAAVSENSFAVMPHQTVSLHSKIFTGDQSTAVEDVAMIENGKVGIKAYVLFFSSMGKKKDFIETFYKSGRNFASTNMEFDPPEEEISEMITQSIKP